MSTDAAHNKQQKLPLTALKPVRLTWLFLSIGVILADQISKWFIVEHVIHNILYQEQGASFLSWYQQAPHISQSATITMTSFFNVVMAWNTGVSFSLFNEMGTFGVYALIAVALGITMIFTYWLLQTKRPAYAVGYALVIGGALGNVIDRARFGAVIDFLDFHAFGYHWPAFNVADMSVVTGIGLLIIASLSFDLRTKGRYRTNNKSEKQTTLSDIKND